MRLHVELRAQRIAEEGGEPAHALRRARHGFGNTDALIEHSRDQWGARRLDIFLQDFRYALRAIAADARLSTAVIVLLGLGLGANAVVFSLADAILIRPPSGVHDASQIQRVYMESNRFVTDYHEIMDEFSYPEFKKLQIAAPAWRFAAYSPAEKFAGLGFADPGRPIDRPQISFATSSYFDVVGAQPYIGRVFGEEENDLARPAHVAVLSHAFWQRRYGADAGIVGRSIDLGHMKVTVIGVASREFTGLDLAATDAWVPVSAWPAHTSPNGVVWYDDWLSFGDFRVVARVPPRAAGDGFEARATAMLRRLHRDNDWGDTASTVITGPVLQAAGPTLKPVSAARITRGLIVCAALVLLVAGANVVNLLLARSARRRRDVAIRTAVGMTRSRLVGQIATETVVVALASAIVAMVIAVSFAGVIRNLVLPDIRWTSSPLTFRVGVFTLVAAVITGSIAALPVSLHATRPQLTSLLNQGERAGRSGALFRRHVVAGQTLMTVMLLIGSGLFARSLIRMSAVNIGYDTPHLLTGHMEFWNPERSVYDNGDDLHWEELARGMTRAADALRSRHGVAAVTIARHSPMQGFRILRGTIYDVNGDPHLSEVGPTPIGIYATPNYFATVGVTVIRGRTFLAEEVWASNVLIVSESTARLYWPGQNALGKCLRLNRATDPCARIVGVVSDVHTQRIVDDPAVAVYLPMGRNVSGLIARAMPGAEATVEAAMKEELQRQFPAADRAVVRSLSSITAQEKQPWRVGATLFSGFAALALVISALGVYSVVAYAVTQQLRELTIRMVLGAAGRDVLALILATGMRGVYMGTAGGVILILALSGVLSPMLFQTSPRDPVILAAAASVMVLFALAACVRPALRAMKLDPAQVMRPE